MTLRWIFALRSLKSGRLLGVVAALATAVSAWAVAPAAAQGASGAFSDDDGAYYEAPFDALAERGILAGTECAEGQICPDDPIERSTMAVWLGRALTGSEPADTGATRFADVDAGHWTVPHIERFAELGVTQGCATDPLRYCPDDNVTRDQMAAFLVRAFDLDDAPSAGFADTAGHYFETEIDQVAAARITLGCASQPLRYCPNQDVTRGQMATFIARALGLVEVPGPVSESIATSIADAEAHMVSLVNELREDLDIAPLEQHSGIATVARRWSNTMLVYDEFAHNPRYFAEYPAGSVIGGENIGQVSYHGDLIAAVQRAFDALSDSPGHYRNMTRASFGQIGVGIAVGSGYVWVTQNFACYPKNGNSSCDPASGQSESEAWRQRRSTSKPESEFWERDSMCDSDAGDGRYTAVAVGFDVVYALRLDGTIACFGFGGNWTPTVPTGNYTSISPGLKHVCALRADDRIACWTSVPDPYDHSTEAWTRRYVPAATAPSGTFLEVAAGEEHSCGLRTDGTITCWGLDYYGETEAPSGTFTAVIAGGNYSCGLRTDRSVVCWGYGAVTDPPKGAFASIAGTAVHVCGLRVEGTVVCWGGRAVGVDPYDQVPGNNIVTNDAVKHPPSGMFTYIFTGPMYACGIRPDSSTECWGQEYLAAALPETQFIQISIESDLATFAACGVDLNHRIVCWNRSTSWRNRGSSYVFQDVLSLASRYNCHIRIDGAARCGERVFQGTYIDAPYVGGLVPDVTCLLSSEGVLDCDVGSSNRSHSRHDWFVKNIPRGTFTDVSIDLSNLRTAACAIRSDGTLVCWDNRLASQPASDLVAGTPEGEFTLVDVSYYRACALSRAGTIECWGTDGAKAFPTPPKGTFVDVSVSRRGACAVRTEGSVVCWSDDPRDGVDARYEEEGISYYVPDNPPDPLRPGLTTKSRVVAETPGGDFISVSRSNFNQIVCGLRRDGDMVCWGDPRDIPPRRPQGPFVEIEEFCGRRQDGTVDCYGWQLPAGVTWIDPSDESRD